MAITRIDNFEAAGETYERLRSPGALLIAGSVKPNVMTIGWGTIGIIWGRPVFVVLVRPSRYTHSFLEDLDEFTVCIPTLEMKDKVMLCGTKSGREVDKITQCGFTMEKSELVSVPYIAQCPVHYECRVLHRNQVIGKELDPEVTDEYYSNGDYHTIYYGEILGAYREI